MAKRRKTPPVNWDARISPYTVNGTPIRSAISKFYKGEIGVSCNHNPRHIDNERAIASLMHYMSVDEKLHEID